MNGYRILLRTLLLFVVFVVLVNSAQSRKKRELPDKKKSAAIQTFPLADPFILLQDNVHDAYGTHSDNGIVVYTSKDM